MGFKSNAEQLNIEINLIATNVHQNIAKMSKETSDYTTLVEQAQGGIQSMMDKTGMSAASAMAQIKAVNTTIIAMRDMAAEAGMSMTGLPQPMNPTMLTAALRDAENIRKGALSTISAEIQAENKLFDIEQKRTLQAEKQVDVMVEKVLQSRAEAAVDENDLAFERLKTAELERQLQLQTGMNAQQRAITAGRIPLADIDMKKAISENVMFDVNKFVGSNGLTPQIDAVTSAMSRIKATNPSVTFDEIGNSMKKAGVNANTVMQGVNKLEPAAKRAGEGFNVLRTAMGFLTAMALSNLFTLFSQGLKKVIDSVTQLQQAFYKLEIAERSISKAGVDITPKELSDIAKEVSNTYKTISRIDSLKMISNLAVLTKDLKLTSEEYRKMALSIPLVAQQAGVSIDSATEQVITGLTKSGRGWADLGITVDAAIIRQEAVNSGLVASAEAYANLTAEQKQQVEVRALLNILEKNTTENLKLQDEYLNSVAGKQALANKQWEDLATLWGETLGPALAAGLGIINTVLETFVAGAERGKKQYVELVSFIQASIWKIDDALSGINTPFSELMDLARSQMNASLAPSLTDTPTVPSITVDETNNQNLLDAQEKFNQAILDAELKLGQDLEDAKIDYERKLYDIDVEYKAKRLELENDYANKVADINRSYQDKIAEINQRQQEDKAKQRNDELQKEREFQNQMLVLKENFLMALDDALHARDARQILKLIKNYELDKAQAERKNALDKQSAKEDAELRQKSYNEDRKKAEADRKAKLAEAQRDYADKIAKLNADEAAEREAARLANERKIEDLHRSMQDRLEVIAAGLVEEYKLTEENLKGIVGLYLKYYNNATQILAAMRAQIAGTMQMMAQMQSYQYSAPIGPVFGGGNLPSSSNLGGSGGSGGSGTGGKPMANGGTIIANKPTTVTFGERGLEAGTFMPLGRVGKDVNSLFSNVSGAGDSNGRVSIELLLSPDLESRIVSNTLNKTAEVFTRTQRAKR